MSDPDATWVAPGKLVLLGEYAVLDGAPALVLAVDRGVSCEVIPHDELHIEVPSSAGDDRFVRAALDAVSAPPAIYRFQETRPLVGPKVGLGGSAAATVAAVAAGLRADERIDRHTLFHAALSVHRAVQGSGSGIDVAASTYGGLLRYVSESATPITHDTLHLSVVFSGQSSKTGPRAERYLAMLDRRSFVEESRALTDGFAADPLTCIRQASTLLQVMARRANIDYWTHSIDRLVTLARVYQGAAKPSGAGGGDIIVALFPDEGARQDYEAAVRAGGWLVVDVKPATGVARGSAIGALREDGCAKA